MRPTELPSGARKRGLCRCRLPAQVGVIRRVSMTSRREFTKALAAVPAAASISGSCTAGPTETATLKFCVTRSAQQRPDSTRRRSMISTRAASSATFSTRLWRTTSSRAPQKSCSTPPNRCRKYRATSRSSRFASGPASTSKTIRPSRVRSASWSRKTTFTRSSASTTPSSRARTSRCWKTRRFLACPRFELQR